jgi:hypothetical protein
MPSTPDTFSLQRIAEELTLFEESYQLSAVSHQPKTKAEA